MKDVIIIGAGVVGALLARKLAAYDLSVLVIEKENDVCNGVSNANSAIVHSGYDPIPGTLKAKLNVLGNEQFDKICDELDVSFQRIGSLTLAHSYDDLSLLDNLKKRADINGVKVEILTKEETRKLEPNISDDIVASLFAPTAGIVDPFNLVAHAMENACDNGVELKLNESVKEIEYTKDKVIVTTNSNRYESKVLVNCAGLFSSIIAKMVDADFKYDINPRKGEYYVFSNAITLVDHVCFPLPSKLGKGVLVSKTTSNNFIVGPNNVPALDLADASTDVDSLQDIKVKALKNFKTLPFCETIRIFSGIRPSISTEDFYIDYAANAHNIINLVGIDSPGLASAPAIADYVIDMISTLLPLTKKEKYNPLVKKYIKMKALTTAQREVVIKTNPDYGQMVCFCEQVSLGEIKDVLSRSVKVTSIKGIKKRTRAGFGKCQGGFCQPLVAKIISEYYNIPLDKVTYDQEDSYLLEGFAK